MGNTTTLNPLITSTTSSSISQSPTSIPWSKQFTLLDKQPTNNTYILHHIPTNSSYKVKHMTLNKTQHQQIFRQIDTKKHTPSVFVTKLEKTQQYTVKGYCSQHQQVFLMYKYIQCNLKEEVLNRRFRQERFSQQQIRVIMQSGVKGISYLHDVGCTPKGLNTSQILLTNERGVIINDPWLSVGRIIGSSKQQSLMNSDNDQTNNSKLYSIPVEDYPSPQKILYMNQLIEQYNQWLSELFTFGMIVLETIFMQSLSEELYDKSHKKIFYHKVKEKIEHIQQGKKLQIVGVSMLNEIKEDLRRLLSHQPKIRQTVYLKYKRSHNNNSEMFLRKVKDDLFNVNSLQQNNSKQQKQNNKQQHKDNKQLGINKIKNYEYESMGQGTKYFSMIQQQQQQEGQIKKNVRKQDWVLNNINSYGEDNSNNNNNLLISNNLNTFNRQKDTFNNKFRVVSTSMPQTNVRYHQLGGGGNSNNNINNGLVQLKQQQQQKYNQYPYTSTTNIVYNNNNNNYNTKDTPTSSYTDYLTTQPMIRVGQLQLNNKQQLVDKSSPYQPQSSSLSSLLLYNNYSQPFKDQYNNKPLTNTTNTNYPLSSSSPYLSTISTNAFQSQINNNPSLSNTQPYYNDGSSNYLTQLKNSNNNTYTASSNNLLNNLPAHMVTRSSSSYVMQQPYNNQHYTQQFNNNNSDNKNTMFTYKLPQTNNQSHLNNNNNKWTYQNMITNNNINNNNNNTNTNTLKQQQKQPQSTYSSTIPPLPKISLSQQQQQTSSSSYLNRYNKIFDNNNNNLNSNQYSNNNINNYQPRSSYQTFKQNFNNTNNYNNNTYTQPSSISPYTNNNYQSAIYQNNQQQQTQQQTNNKQPQISQNPIITPSNPSYKQLSNFNFREVGSLYCEDSHFLNDKQSIVIESYSTGGIINNNNYNYNNKYPLSTQTHNRTQAPLSGFSREGSININKTRISPKNSFQINHSMINNTRNQGKSFSSMDQDLKELRKFGQQQQQNYSNNNQQQHYSSIKQSLDNNNNNKKPNSSYSSSQKVSLIDKIYDPQVMGSFDRRSFQNNHNNSINNNQQHQQQQDYFAEQYNHQSDIILNKNNNNNNNNRSSQNITTTTHHRQDKHNPHSRNNSSQNYLQTPQRYPTKYKLNSTIRQASCQDSGVNQSLNNSNGINGDSSYQHQKVYPNTEISKYQLMNQQRRYSDRKIVDQQQENVMENDKGFKTDRGTAGYNRQTLVNNTSQNQSITRQQPQSQQNNYQNNHHNHNEPQQHNQPQNNQRVTLYADGSRYIGPTDQKGQSHGYGVLYYPDGHVAYQGEWQNGDFNGKGRLYNPYELKMEKSFDYRDLTKMDQYIKQFQGTFNHDVKQGKGILKMHNNQVYEGNFRNDLPNGRGKFNCVDGNVVEGLWERGYLQETY